MGGLYENGRIPLESLVIFNSGFDQSEWEAVFEGRWVHALSPATYARHVELVKRAKRRTGNTLQISSGWGAYRPFEIQVLARARYGNGAAWPGTSSHGGYWEDQNTMAMDYSNWASVYGGDNPNTRAAFAEDCASVGLTAFLISTGRGYPDEPWHVNDLNPWSAVPSFPGSEEEEDDMKAVRQDGVPNSGIIIQAATPPYSMNDQVFDALCGSYGLTAVSLPDWKYGTVVREQWTAAGASASLEPKGDGASVEIATNAIVSGVLNGIDESIRKALPVEEIYKRISALPADVLAELKKRL